MLASNYSVEIHFFKSSTDGFEFNTFPSITFVELETLVFILSIVLPKPLPPEVAKRIIFLFEKSCLSKNVFTIVGAIYHQIGKPKYIVS